MDIKELELINALEIRNETTNEIIARFDYENGKILLKKGYGIWTHRGDENENED